MLRAVKRVLDRWVLAVASVLFVLMILIVFLQVICRYVFDNSLSWSEEVARYLLVWTIFLSAGYVLGQGCHIFLDVVFGAFPQRLQKIFRRFSDILLLGFSMVVVMYGAELVMIGKVQRSTAVGIPMWLVYTAIPLGGLLLLFYSFYGVVAGQEETRR
jgi:TRAP-type C4-dicarboxylate transport system permease small subunit